MAIKKKVGDTIYSPIGLHRKVNGVDYDIQAMYKGVMQNGSVVGVKVLEKSQPSVLIPLEYYVPSASALIRTDSSMTHGWEIVATMQANSVSAEFFCGYQSGATNAYLASESGTMRVYGSASQAGSKALGTDKAVVDINCHMADQEAPGAADEYDWMFLNYNWDGHTQTAAAGFQVAYAKVTGIYPDATPQFYTDGNIKLYSYDVYYQAKNDRTTKTKTRSYEPYYDVTNDKIVMKSGEEYSWDAQGTAGHRKGAEPVSFVGSPVGYIYDNKIWSDSLCYSTLYTAGTYTSTDGGLYTVASDGSFIKEQSISNTISGHTRTAGSSVSIKINGTAHTVTSGSDLSFSLDCSPYYPITSLSQCVYNNTYVNGVKADINTSQCANFVSAFSNIMRTSAASGIIDVSGLSMSKATTMQSMFYSDNYATEIRLPNLHSDTNTTIKWMFYNCQNVTTLNLSTLGDCSSINDCQGVFQGCAKLAEIDFSGTTNLNPGITTNMFSGCSVLSQIKVGECDNTTINTLISALSNAGFTFIQSGNYLIKQ